MLLLSEEQVRQLCDPDRVIEALQTAFTRDVSTVQMPVRSSLPLENGGVLLLMPACDSGLGAAGVKTVTVTISGRVNASYELIDSKSGGVLARMEANWLTDLRTAAASAVATNLLSREDARVLGVFGTGRQAEAHVAMLPRVRKFARILVCGSPNSDAAGFCDRMKSRYQIQVQPSDPETCVRESDVVCTCTTSPVPVFEGYWLKAGAHVNAIGAFQPQTREVDDETVRRSRVVVDTYAGALAEAGDILIPMASGVIGREQIIGDLHEIASGRKPGRTSPADITLFKSVGCALEDLVTAKLIYERARA